MTWYDLTFTSSHILTASDMNRLQGNFTALAEGHAGAPALAVAMPTGAVIPYAGTSAPAGWLLCNGGAVSRTTYADLFGLIGTIFGAGDGSTTFNLPDLRGRVVAALDNLGGSSANRLSATWADSLGGVGGTETHSLSLGEIAAHKHTFNGAIEIRYNVTPSGALSRQGIEFRSDWDTGITLDMDNAGGGGAHNNVQPTMALGYIIKT